ncbi:MAG TPA: trypsin-like peptidase domain-containing protein [Micromonosporaceae bacterium]|nr:trypsin-like peptidase domain-containing protein [Micromonosporaceae bacterium]
MGALFEQLRRRLRGTGYPEPQQFNTNTAANLALVRNFNTYRRPTAADPAEFKPDLASATTGMDSEGSSPRPPAGNTRTPRHRGLGRIRGGRRSGAGFAINGRIVVTAGHVVAGQKPADLSFVEDVTGEAVAVQDIDHKPELDVAFLRLTRDVATDIRVRRARLGERWYVDTRTLRNDPRLTGTVEALDKPITSAGGHDITVMQLDVAQHLQGFEGYSGGAVMRARRWRRNVAIGVLTEQVRVRRERAGAGPPPATNVLYAMPLLTTPFPASRRAVWLRVGALIFAAALVLGAAFALLRESPRTSVTVDSPKAGEVVPRCFAATGHADHLAQDDRLWLVIRTPDDDNRQGPFWLMQELSPGSRGRWQTALMTLGDVGGKGRPFWISVYAVDRAANVPTQGDTGFDALPPGFRLLTDVQVVRGDDNTPTGGRCEDLNPPPSYRVRVDPTNWNGSLVPGLVVVEGRTILVVDPVGQWECGDDPDMGRTGIGGYQHYAANKEKYALTDAPLCSLMGRVGPTGQWTSLAVGSMVADTSGSLYLAVNELPPDKCDQSAGKSSCYTDNVGYVEVTIRQT